MLEKEYCGEFDAWIYLYTKEMGKLRAKARSVRKITSKLGSHLEPGLLVNVRLVSKSSDASLIRSFQIADALSGSRFYSDFQFLAVVKDLTLDLHSENAMWDFLLEGKPNIEKLLQISGFGSLEIGV